jgi:serine protease AprX
MPTVLLLQKRPTLSPDQLKALLRTTAKDLKQADALGRGQGLLDLKQASGASIPAVTTQPYPTATGLGSLEAARGTIHILDGDLELVGEQDSFGDPGTAAGGRRTVGPGPAGTAGPGTGARGRASSTTSTRRTCWGGRIAYSATPGDPCRPLDL